MSRRNDREIFSRRPRKRGMSKWAIGAATILLGIAIAAPSVAAKDCLDVQAPCNPVPVSDKAILDGVAEAEVPAAIGVEQTGAKIQREDSRRKVAGVAILGLLFGGNGGTGIGLQ